MTHHQSQQQQQQSSASSSSASSSSSSSSDNESNTNTTAEICTAFDHSHSDLDDTDTALHHSLVMEASPDDIVPAYFNSPDDSLTYSTTSMVEPFTIPDHHQYYYYPSLFTTYGPVPPDHHHHHHQQQQQQQQQQHHHHHGTTTFDSQSSESNSDYSDITDSFSGDPRDLNIKMEHHHYAADNDYNVAMTLAKEMPIPQLVSYSHPSDHSPVFSPTLVDCFPMHPHNTDLPFVTGLSSPPLSEHTKIAPLSPISTMSTLSPLSPLSPIEEHHHLFDLESKSIFPRDLAMDGRDYFVTDPFMNELVRRKSYDDAILLRKIAASQTKSEEESCLMRRKSLPNDLSQRLHIESLQPAAKQSRKSSKTLSPFRCPHEHCPKTFTRQYNLKSHLRTHTDERPFVCTYPGCPRAFARQHDLKRHQKLHLGLKPHVCGNCGRAFARLDALNRHLRSDNAAQCAQATLANAVGASLMGVSVTGKPYLKSATL